MKKIFKLFALVLCFMMYAQQPPQTIKTEFSQEVLKQKITSQDGKIVQIGDILKQYEGKILIVDFWASWCRDCILALPKTEQLKRDFPQIEFVYFSLDRSHNQWLKGLERYNIANENNYWFDEGWKNSFNNYIELNWVPRFILIDQSGKIAKYYAITPDDPELVTSIKKLID